jgi:hypothetical protein
LQGDSRLSIKTTWRENNEHFEKSIMGGPERNSPRQNGNIGEPMVKMFEHATAF